ncbi:uncharacterized protein A1O5_11490 [Cladophialophora psammophila CBS 110553]|uniref:Uncharacterized protein n=1 Tax=Cladophialophora psammophila CBS 110553 TaxID=1182543 RepID=W9WFT5_9EURO|nr:uncharacterized protein A1O5_11490 [Cladophialophora psammophila CBS 110553]EXJ63441.1 hypothetical protein A1O5_11490 [Cladophialophora psammophila CBS 110553]
MIQKCATTLEDLDNATKKYREGAKMPDDADEADAGPSQKRRKLLRRKIASNWAKILWDIDKDSLKIYRDRLQSHVDNLNLVLNTFHWSATERIHAHNKLQEERMQEFHDKMVQSNSSLGLLVKGIHSVLLEPKQTAFPSLSTDIKPEIEGPGGCTAETSSTGTNDLASMEKKSIAAHRISIVMLNAISTNAMADIAMPFVPASCAARAYMRPPAALEATEQPSDIKLGKTRKELPPEIVSINIKRQIQGAKALADLKQSLAPKPRPSFLEPAVPTVAQLAEGLDFLFNPSPQSNGQQFEITRQTRVKEVSLWIQSFGHLVDSVAAACAESVGGSSKTAVFEQRSDLISLLSNINEAIESSSANMRDMFYEACSAMHIDQVLDKLLSLTNSVRGMKEVEEFMEERTNWMDEH